MLPPKVSGLIFAIWTLASVSAQAGGAPQQPKAPKPSSPFDSGLPSKTAKPSADLSRPVDTASTTAPGAPAIPDDFKINLLIRTTILAINQANRTGNYTVLRDLGAPGFQKVNTAAKLAEKFSNQRNADLDLGPILFFNPTLIRKPALNADNMLHVSGFFPTRPQQVNFDFLFDFIDGEWRHFGLGLGTQAVTDVPAVQ